MANKTFPKFRQAIQSPGIGDLATATIKAVAIDTGAYTQSDAHEFLSSVPTVARFGVPQTLTSKTFSATGVFDAADIEFPALAAGTGTGNAIEALILYVEGANDGASRLVAYIDTAEGLPLVLNGSSGKITWHASGIYGL